MTRSAWHIQKAVLFALYLRELKTRFGAHRFGALWLVLEPMAHVMVMVTLFSFIRDRVVPGVDFAVFLLVGLVPFFMFKSIAIRIMEGVEGNRALFSYRHITPMDVFITRALLEVLLYALVYALLLVAMGLYGLDVRVAHPMDALLAFAQMALFGFALGVVFSILVSYLPAAKIVIRIMFIPLYLMSGIIFPIARLPHDLLPWLLWNPLLHATELSRAAMFAAYPLVPGIDIGYVPLWILCALFAGLWFYRYRRFVLVANP